MGVWSGLKKGLDFVFYIRPKQWVSWDFMSQTTTQTLKMVRGIYTVSSKKSPETFYQALERHRLSLDDLESLKKRFFYLSLFFFSFALGMIIYALHGFFENYLLQSLGSVSISVFLLAQSFKYHFWYFQIVQKRLGCSLREWASFLIS